MVSTRATQAGMVAMAKVPVAQPRLSDSGRLSDSDGVDRAIWPLLKLKYEDETSFPQVVRCLKGEVENDVSRWSISC